MGINQNKAEDLEKGEKIPNGCTEDLEKSTRAKLKAKAEAYSKAFMEILGGSVVLGALIGGIMGLVVFFNNFASIELVLRTFIEKNSGQPMILNCPECNSNLDNFLWVVGIINTGIIGSSSAATLGALSGILPGICLAIVLICLAFVLTIKLFLLSLLISIPLMIIAFVLIFIKEIFFYIKGKLNFKNAPHILEKKSPNPKEEKVQVRIIREIIH